MTNYIRRVGRFRLLRSAQGLGNSEVTHSYLFGVTRTRAISIGGPIGLRANVQRVYECGNLLSPKLSPKTCRLLGSMNAIETLALRFRDRCNILLIVPSIVLPCGATGNILTFSGPLPSAIINCALFTSCNRLRING